MNVSVFETTVTSYISMLTNLKAILKKANAFADQKKIEMPVLLQMRLAPDMFPLSRQIQIASDVAKLSVARLAHADAPKFEDNEQTYEQFIERIDKTVAFLKTIKLEQFQNYEKAEYRTPWKPGFHLEGRAYLVQHALPTFYFHLTTAYAILRHAGVEIGKGDYLGSPDWVADK